jgi:hypothetical protein
MSKPSTKAQPQTIAQLLRLAAREARLARKAGR